MTSGPGTPGSTDFVPEPAGTGTAPVAALSFLVVILIGIPSQLVFAPLGAAGSPAQLFGLVLLLVWATDRIAGSMVDAAQTYWLRAALVAFVATVLASYVSAMIRPIEGPEMRAADRGLLSVIAWVGLLLYAMDGLTARWQLETVLRRVCGAGVVLALLGFVQFFTKSTIVDAISIPGLTANQDLGSVADRGGFTRPAGTAIHPIEFGGVLTLIFPLALHFGFVDRVRRGFVAWLPAAVIGAMLMISLSRSAILATVVALGVVVTGWPSTMRRGMYGAAVLMVLVVYVTIPGMLGTFLRLFTVVGTDSSTLSRTDSYALAWDFISRDPLFGRGIRTFLPAYRILDNQFLGSAIEMGLLGAGALLAVFWTAIFLSLRMPVASAEDQSLTRCLAAGIAGCGVSFGTFDAFSFPMVPTLLFLLIGCAGALATMNGGGSIGQGRVPSPFLQSDRYIDVRRVAGVGRRTTVR